jgi:hypothetical protein
MLGQKEAELQSRRRPKLSLFGWVKGSNQGQNVELRDLKRYFTQNQANHPSYCDIS